MVLATIGPRAITLKELNSLIQFLMLFGKRLKIVIACKVFKYVTLLEGVPDPVWEPY